MPPVSCFQKAPRAEGMAQQTQCITYPRGNTEYDNTEKKAQFPLTQKADCKESHPILPALRGQSKQGEHTGSAA